MGFMVSGGGFRDGNAYRWWDHKHPSFPYHTFSEDTNWDTLVVHIIVAI